VCTEHYKVDLFVTYVIAQQHFRVASFNDTMKALRKTDGSSAISARKFVALVCWQWFSTHHSPAHPLPNRHPYKRGTRSVAHHQTNVLQSLKLAAMLAKNLLLLPHADRGLVPGDARSLMGTGSSCSNLSRVLPN
jgi:hypothetical protein